LSEKAKISFRKARAVAPTYNRVAEVIHNKSANRYNYGKNNLLPNELLTAIEAGVTASACRQKKSTFIAGKGLADVSISSMMVNSDQTANHLISELSDYAGVFRGIALKVIYNILGEPYRVTALEFECVRATDDGRFYYNEKLNDRKDVKADRIYMDVFNRHESPSSRLRRVRGQIDEYGRQVGDIIYHFEKKAGQKIYPKPVAWAGMEEIEADAALGRLDWRNVKRGFRPDVILTTIGEYDDEHEDEAGKTEQDYFDASIDQFCGEDATPILNIRVDKKEQAPEVFAFDSEKLLNSTTEAADRVARRVCRAMEVPDILIPGLARQGQLGNTQELLHTMKLFALTSLDYQRLIAQALEMVWPQFDWTIEPLELIEEIPDWLIDKLTDDEVRALKGYKPLQQQPTE